MLRQAQGGSTRTGANDFLQQGRDLRRDAAAKGGRGRAEDGDLECNVCWEGLNDATVVRLDCAGHHAFCMDCVANWFRASLSNGERRCPYCRQACFTAFSRQ
ncbi:hypothetical protein T484DRAFT_1878253, partial [Baffinella frigidus]